MARSAPGFGRMAGTDPPVFAIVATVVVAVLLLAMLLTGGEHGPGRHGATMIGDGISGRG